MVTFAPLLTDACVPENRFHNVPTEIAVYELARVGHLAQSVVTDPVCRMQVEPGTAAATVSHLGLDYHFCSPHCARLFREAPERYARLWG